MATTETCAPATWPVAVPLDFVGSRYTLLGLLGRGGIGEVHAAWDRVLERRVALKWLRPERAVPAAEARLVREAQALARLNHPHVVTVHDVGSREGRSFLAMEFIAGPTLAEWLAAEARPRRTVLALFRDAGRGLAALHRAELVHRDFKPGNVLVAPGGRAVVTDLGLARAVSEAPDPAADGAGTPAYMAPEQRRGEPADARSDQYSFAVALWEALHGARPGPPAPRAGRRPPRGVERALRRALSEDPVDRFPRLEDLLLVLDRALARRRGFTLAALGVLGTTLGLGFATDAVHRRAALCSGGEAAFARVFGARESAALRSAFLGSGHPRAGEIAARTITTLEHWGGDWARGHQAACAATRLEGSQSEQLLDRRTACLESRLQEAGALVALLEQADGELVGRAQEVMAGLPRLDACANTTALLARVPPPTEPALARQVAVLGGARARAHALLRVGDYRAARDAALALRPEAAAVGWPPLQAATDATLCEAYARLGAVDDALATCARALTAALAGGDDAVFAEAAAIRAWWFAEAARFAEAEHALELADAALARLGESPSLASRLASLRGEIRRQQGRWDEAITAHERAVAIGRRPGTAPGGEVDPWDHASHLNNLAGALASARRVQEAIPVLVEALAAKRLVLEPDHPSIAASLANLGTMLRNAGDPEAAAPFLEEARALRLRRLGPDHLDTLNGEINYGGLQSELGRAAEALATLDAVLVRFARLGSRLPPQVAFAHVHRGQAFRQLGRTSEARLAFAEALRLLELHLPPSHPQLAGALLGQGELELDLGRPRRARPLLEKGLGLHGAPTTGPDSLRGRLLFALARASVDEDPDRARTLAEEALARFAGTSNWLAARRAAVAAWLATEGSP